MRVSAYKMLPYILISINYNSGKGSLLNDDYFLLYEFEGRLKGLDDDDTDVVYVDVALFSLASFSSLLLNIPQVRLSLVL